MILVINIFSFILIGFFLTKPSHGYSIELSAGATECFIVTATAGTPITGSYEVIHPDPELISVMVTGPNNDIHFTKNSDKEIKESGDESDKEEAAEGYFTFDSELSGDYTMCLSNGDEKKNDGESRLIAFNFRAAAEGEKDYQFVGLQSELEDLKEGLQQLKDHQSYMNQREDVHKESLESINTKVLTWTILEAVILIAMALWQIFYIRSFFETKRRL
eukprot:gene9576-12899_t